MGYSLQVIDVGGEKMKRERDKQTRFNCGGFWRSGLQWSLNSICPSEMTGGVYECGVDEDGKVHDWIA